jgi:Mrp family chromosome partitioning ATPase
LRHCWAARKTVRRSGGLGPRAVDGWLRQQKPRGSGHGKENRMKKAAVCGKGGSGKSTVVTLLAGAFRDRLKGESSG